MLWRVYRALNLDNGKLYFGITRQMIAVRWKWHVYNARHSHKKGRHAAVFHRAIMKYGAKRFYVEMIYEAVNLREAVAVERAMIASYRSFIPYGYNMTLGGEGSDGMAQESRDRISRANKGRIFTLEQRERMGRAHWKGVDGPKRPRKLPGAPRKKQSREAIERGAETRRGRKRSLAAIAKTAAANRGRKRRPGTGEKISRAKKGKPAVPISLDAKIEMTRRRLSDLRAAGASGIKGVRFRRGRWEANIKLDRHSVFLGTFDESAPAAVAFLGAVERHLAALIAQQVARRSSPGVAGP